MARPTKHYGKWRIRWEDASGTRHSETYDDFDVAKRVLRDRELTRSSSG